MTHTLKGDTHISIAWEHSDREKTTCTVNFTIFQLRIVFSFGIIAPPSSIFVVRYGGVPFETVNVLDENNNPGVREAHVRSHIGRNPAITS